MLIRSGRSRYLLPACGAALAACMLWHAKPALAQTASGWKGAGGANNNWSNAANWDNGVPGTSGAQGSVRDLFFGVGYNTAGGTLTTANNDLSVNGYRITFQA